MSAGHIVVLSAPSGAGKTTLAHAVMKRLAARGLASAFSVSYTTREPRPGEQDGVDYHFVSREQFEHMVQAGQMLEHAEVFGRYYGTGRAKTAEALAAGRLLFLDIDWQGARQLRESMAQDCASVFILPPSREALLSRLQGRAQDSEDVIQQRMDEAVSEMSHFDEFDYLIVNDELDRAADELEALCLSFSLKRGCQTARHKELLAELLQSN